jgi:hypothetical protein
VINKKGIWGDSSPQIHYFFYVGNSLGYFTFFYRVATRLDQSLISKLLYKSKYIPHLEKDGGGNAQELKHKDLDINFE